MKLILLALAFAVQNQPVFNEAERGPNTGFPPERTLSPAHDLYFEDSAPSTLEARIAAQDFGACVADTSAVVARDVLKRDFTTRAYDRSLRRLIGGTEDCLRRRGSMRSSSLILAGAIAERLIEREDGPINVRLARAALRPSAPTFSVSDRAANCVVRSVPDDVARLFESEVAGDAETTMTDQLRPVLAACLGTGQPIEATPAGLRAILATAAFREINADPPTAETRN